MRKRIFEIIEIGKDGDTVSKIYDFFMIAVIVASLSPLVFKESSVALKIIDYVTVAIFVIDYLLRFITADMRFKKGAVSFIRYPFSVMAIIDLISIIPTFIPLLNSGFRVLKVIRLIRTLKVFRVFKGFRYSKNIEKIIAVIKKERSSLITVLVLAVGYIVVIALIMFNVEPETFDTFFDAIYWSCVSLTTMGYGDIYAVSAAGKVITMISALVGIAIVALPTGIISSGFMAMLQEEKEKKQYDKE